MAAKLSRQLAMCQIFVNSGNIIFLCKEFKVTGVVPEKDKLFFVSNLLVSFEQMLLSSSF